MPVWGRPLLTALSLAIAAFAWFACWRRTRDAPDGDRSADLLRYGHAPLAAVLALLIFAPILSPQYLIWMLPFAAVVAAAGDRRVGVLTFVANALSTIGLLLIFPAQEGMLVGTLPVLVRNVLLVALLVISFQALVAAPPDTRDGPGTADGGGRAAQKGEPPSRRRRAAPVPSTS
jgi:hypothetical protein